MLNILLNNFPVWNTELSLCDVALRRAIINWTTDDLLLMKINTIKWNLNQNWKLPLQTQHFKCRRQNAVQCVISVDSLNFRSVYTKPNPRINHRRIKVPLRTLGHTIKFCCFNKSVIFSITFLTNVNAPLWQVNSSHQKKLPTTMELRNRH